MAGKFTRDSKPALLADDDRREAMQYWRSAKKGLHTGVSLIPMLRL